MKRIISWTELMEDVDKRTEEFEITGSLAITLIPIIQRMEKKEPDRLTLAPFSLMGIDTFKEIAASVIKVIPKTIKIGIHLYLFYRNYYCEAVDLDYYKFTLKNNSMTEVPTEIEQIRELNDSH